MPRFILLAVAVLFLFSVTVSYAQNDRGRGQGQGNQNQNNNGSQNENRGNGNGNAPERTTNTTQVAPSSSPATRGKAPQKVQNASGSAEQTCDPSLEYTNHGEYVRCVAKLKLGGKVVSEAAKSDIGKKKEGTPSASFNPSPSASGSAQPSPEATESATPSATISPTPEGTPSGIFEAQFTSVVENVKGFFKKLRTFLPF